MSKILVTGASGQDGSFACDYYLKKGKEVVALVRQNSSKNLYNIEYLRDHKNLEVVYANITDNASIRNLFVDSGPFHKILHFAAESFVGASWKCPEVTFMTNTVGTLNILENARIRSKDARIYLAGSSEMVGNNSSYSEESMYQFHPMSPYGISKLAAFWLGVNNRCSYKTHIVNGILFNHSSERRGIQFVMRKISQTVANALYWLKEGGKKPASVPFGNLNVMRDIGYAKEYVEIIDHLLNIDEPQDYVLGTGMSCPLRILIATASESLGIFPKVEWQGKDINEKCYLSYEGKRIEIIHISEKFFRPSEIRELTGSHEKIKRLTGISPKHNGLTVIQLMTKFDYKLRKARTFYER